MRSTVEAVLMHRPISPAKKIYMAISATYLLFQGDFNFWKYSEKVAEGSRGFCTKRARSNLLGWRMCFFMVHHFRILGAQNTNCMLILSSHSALILALFLRQGL
jgi:hypothetical protein